MIYVCTLGWVVLLNSVDLVVDLLYLYGSFVFSLTCVFFDCGYVGCIYCLVCLLLCLCCLFSCVFVLCIIVLFDYLGLGVLLFTC